MDVYVNDQKVIIHDGGRVKDAILKFNSDAWTSCRKGDLLIMDSSRNERSPDGPITESEHIFLVKNEKK